MLFICRRKINKDLIVHRENWKEVELVFCCCLLMFVEDPIDVELTFYSLPFSSIDLQDLKRKNLRVRSGDQNVYFLDEVPPFRCDEDKRRFPLGEHF